MLLQKLITILESVLAVVTLPVMALLLMVTVLLAIPAQATEPARAAEPAAAGKSDKGWHLRQNSVAAGEFNVWLTNYGAKLESIRQGYGLLITGNDFFEYNSHRKLYRRAELSHWTPLSAGEFLLRDGNFSNLRVVSAVDEPTNGIILSHEVLKTSEKFIGNPKTKSEHLAVVRADYWLAKSVPCPHGVLPIVEKLYGIPGCNSFPVRLMYVNRKFSHHQELQTIKAEPIAISSAMMKIPADYKLVHLQKEVYVDGAGENTLKDMLLE